MQHALFYRALEIGVFQQDIRRLAAKLLMHALHGGGGALRHLGAGPGRTREGHHVHFLMRGQRRADIHAIAVDQIEHAGGYAGFVHDLGPENGAERRIFRRLQYHGAAGREGGHDLGGHLVHGPVPRGDECAHADRLLHQPRIAVHFLEFKGLEYFDHGTDMADADAGLGSLGEGDGGAHFDGNGLSDLVIVRLVGG